MEGGIHFLGASEYQTPSPVSTTTALDKNFVLTATSTLNLTDTCLGTKAI